VVRHPTWNTEELTEAVGGGERELDEEGIVLA